MEGGDWGWLPVTAGKGCIALGSEVRGEQLGCSRDGGFGTMDER